MRRKRELDILIFLRLHELWIEKKKIVGAGLFNVDKRR